MSRLSNPFALYINGNKVENELVIPNGVTNINDYAFYKCSGLTSVTIPDSVTSIGNGAFADCTSVSIYCQPKELPSTWSSTWNSSNRPVVWGYAGAKGTTSDGFKWSSVTGDTIVICGYNGLSASVTIPTTINGKTVSGICENAFRNNSTITSVFIPACIERVGFGAFMGCSNLTINCEIASAPSGWSSSWIDSNTTVYWGM